MVYCGMEGTPYRVLCVAAVEALRLFFFSEGAVQGVGGMLPYFFFGSLFHRVKYFFRVGNQYAEC